MNETFSYDGKYFKMPQREVIPKPIQKPHPPMWVAATQPSTWEVAGQKGIGALGFGISEPGMIDKLIEIYKKAISTCEPVGAFVNDRTAAATVCVCAPTREEAKLIAKDAIDFTTRKAAELFTPFAKQEVKGYEYYKKMAEQAVAIGDYRLSLADLDKRIEAGRGDGRRPGRLPEGRKDLRIGGSRSAPDAGAGRRDPARKGDADYRPDWQARDAEAKPEREGFPGGIRSSGRRAVRIGRKMQL